MLNHCAAMDKKNKTKRSHACVLLSVWFRRLDSENETDGSPGKNTPRMSLFPIGQCWVLNGPSVQLALN